MAFSMELAEFDTPSPYHFLVILLCCKIACNIASYWSYFKTVLNGGKITDYWLPLHMFP